MVAYRGKQALRAYSCAALLYFMKAQILVYLYCSHIESKCIHIEIEYFETLQSELELFLLLCITW